MSEVNRGTIQESGSPSGFFVVLANEAETKILTTICESFAPDNYGAAVERNAHFELQKTPLETKLIRTDGRYGTEVFTVKEEQIDPRLPKVKQVRWTPSDLFKKVLAVEAQGGEIALFNADADSLAEGSFDLVHKRFGRALMGFRIAIHKEQLKRKRRSFLAQALHLPPFFR